jgi:uncharacterized membrane protein
MKNEAEVGHHEIIIALFAGKDSGQNAIKLIAAQASNTVPDLKGQTAVIRMDENGKVTSDTPQGKGKTGKGAVLGGLVGLLVGLPVGGAIVGGIIGYTRRGKHHESSDEEHLTVAHLVDHMKPDSSIVVAEVEDWQASTVADSLHMNGAVKVVHAQKDKLAALIEEYEAQN